MTKSQLVKKISEHVRAKFSHEATGHDWYHIQRVWKMAKYIAKKEKNADMFIVELAALCHELGDYKLEADGIGRHEQQISQVLSAADIPPEIQRKVIDIVKNISFSKNVSGEHALSLEGQVVQDADRLEAIGAIGIARAFAYGGAKGRVLYDPEQKPKKFKTTHSYQKSATATINHFYEKLLLLKSRMRTTTGKQIAIKRHAYMENYLKQFFAEWDGKL